MNPRTPPPPIEDETEAGYLLEQWEIDYLDEPESGLQSDEDTLWIPF